MGNYFTKKKTSISYSELKDNDDNKFMLYDDVQGKLENNESDLKTLKTQVNSLHENYSRNILLCNKKINEMTNTITELTKKNGELNKNFKLVNIISEKNSNKIKELEMKIMNLESIEEFVSTIQESNAEQDRKMYFDYLENNIGKNVNKNINIDGDANINDSLDEINNDITNFGKSLEID